VAHQRSSALALGTVQFGVRYGVAGRGEAVPEAEVRDILEAAAAAGVRVLDTAPAYGDIEERLGRLADGLAFDIVSKVAALPDDSSEDDARRFTTESVSRSQARLGDRLTTLLFHRADDLAGPHGDAIWRAASDAARGKVRIGVSCYDPVMLADLAMRYPISVAQLPGNALDQRLTAPELGDSLRGIEIHLRSVFLQGLLLMPAREAATRVPASAAALERWSAWIAGEGMPPVGAALAVGRSLPGVSLCVVGVDRRSQLDEIIAAWRLAAPREAPALACDSLEVIDPRRWGK
jgi:aryl-alcohol dehydrogenase-like predicted oxidoreductase